MSGIRGTNTKPELVVRRFLHRRGFRFVLHDRRLPGRPDIVLPRHHAVVDVRGCFWHRHPGCRLAAKPKSNSGFWEAKLNGNAERDARNTAALEEAGWRVFVIWECEAGNDDVLTRLAREIRRRRR